MKWTTALFLLSWPAMAAAADIPTTVTIELNHSDLAKKAKEIDAADAPTPKATLRFRQFRSPTWLEEKEITLKVTMNSKGDKPLKYEGAHSTTLKGVDAKKRIEWQFSMPTEKGKFLVYAEAKEPKSNGKLELQLKGGGAPKAQDKAEWAWPSAGTDRMANTNLDLELLDPEIAKASSKQDSILLKDGKVPITVWLRDSRSGETVGKSEIEHNALKPVRFIDHFFSGGIRPVAAREGEPLDFRVTIPTEKGRVFVGEGKTTATETWSSTGNARLTIEAKLHLREASEVVAWKEPVEAAPEATPTASAPTTTPAAIASATPSLAATATAVVSPSATPTPTPAPKIPDNIKNKLKIR